MRLTEDRTLVRAAILEEHERIRSILSRLHTGADASHLPELIRELVDLLTAHFAREESVSLVADHPGRFARFAKALERLSADHEEILNGLQTLLEHPPASPSDEALRRVLNKLERHEAAETEILQRAYADDLGGGG